MTSLAQAHKHHMQLHRSFLPKAARVVDRFEADFAACKPLGPQAAHALTSPGLSATLFVAPSFAGMTSVTRVPKLPLSTTS